MTPNRLEAFSDGVLAIIITIMVLELKAPTEGADLFYLLPLIPKFLFYLLSFIYIGIYWNNHHHLFKATKRVNGLVLWANLALLFFLSLIPFTTSWMGEYVLDEHPASLYGINLLCCAISFMILEKMVIKAEGEESVVSFALEDQRKEKGSLALYILGIVFSFIYTPIAMICYALVALLWLMPDRRLEKNL
ncbi:DUF1211 domain-containing protein [Flavobacteriaceae bacterium Ap0902]|nr:DUF1211 domain-containing protein [Flavobacteriaceae bacterium Ap0902]